MTDESRIKPELQIDPEFESKIPPLTDEEYRQLEENIVADGMVIMPLIIWNGTVVDGHNRYKIVQAHPEIAFSVHEKAFENRYEALAWICKNQLGRRNLTPEQKRYLIGSRYNAEKMANGGDRRSEAARPVVHSEPLISAHVTRSKIAQDTNTNESFVMRSGWYAEGVDAAEEAMPGIKQDLLSGKLKAPHKAVAAIAKVSPEERQPLVDSILHPAEKSPKAEKAEPSSEKPGQPRPVIDIAMTPHSGRASKESMRLAHSVSEEMARPRGPVTEESILLSLKGEVLMTMQVFDDLFDEWPKLINEERYHNRVIEILHDLKQYIQHIEGGTRFEYEQTPLQRDVSQHG